VKTNKLQLVITDMDGTLLNGVGEISEVNVAAIRKLRAAGVKFAIATGRADQGIRGILSQYQLEEDLDYIISLNGVQLYHKQNDSSHSFGELEGQVINEVYQQLKMYDVAFAVHIENQLVSSKTTTYTDVECQVNGYVPTSIETFEELLNRKYPKLMIIGDESTLDEIAQVLAKTSSDDFDFFRSHEYFLEVVKKNVSKGEAIKHLCELDGLDISRVMAIGDNYNDLTMIQYSGIGVAMNNACEEIKSHANFITKSNEEDGFAHAVHTYL